MNGRNGDPVEAIQALGGADVALVLAVSPSAMRQAFDSLKRGGRLVLVSLPRDNELELPIFQTVLKGISVVGSIIGTRRGSCFDQVLSGEVPARLVLEF